MFYYTFSVINTMFVPCTALPYDSTAATRTLTLSTTLMRWRLISRTEHSPHFSNRTLEYLRHNFPWDRLILRQTDNPWPSYSQDLNPSDYFLKGYLKYRVCEKIHRQERTSSEKKPNGFYKKCSLELWTILMFELLLCYHTAAWCIEQT